MSRTLWPTSISSTSTRYIACIMKEMPKTWYLWWKAMLWCGIPNVATLLTITQSTEGKEEGRSRGSWKCINTQPHQDSSYRGLFKGFPSMRKKMLFLLRWNAQEWWRCTSNHNCWSRRKGASCCSHPICDEKLLRKLLHWDMCDWWLCVPFIIQHACYPSTGEPRTRKVTLCPKWRLAPNQRHQPNGAGAWATTECMNQHTPPSLRWLISLIA